MTEKRSQNSDVAFIEALARLLREQDLTEIEVDRSFGPDDTLSVRVARQIEAVAPVAVPAPAAIAAAPPQPITALASAAAEADPALMEGAVTSPMVGTAYLQPEPGAPPYVKVGDQVDEGQTLLIVEAMKTMNHIPAPRAGRVKRILIDDGAPVEFGAPLMILE
jgi:acetyl-CoA carboxylase biotin carboxyl carrier protein